MSRYITTLSLLCCSSLSSLAAESNSSSGSKNFLTSDFFSLSKKKESSFDASAAVYVLSSEDIRRSGVTSIPEALRMVPGLQVARIDGNKWAISSRGFNRQFSNKLLIMIDGRTIYTPTFSGAFWDNQDYVIEDIEKIEVIRGPGGSIWGANAMNGIINIITKSAAETQGTYVSQIAGNNDKSITEARYGGKVGDTDSYRAYVKRAIRGAYNKVDNNSQSNYDGIVQNRAGFKYDLNSVKDSAISIHGDVFDGKSNNYFSTLNNPEKNDKDSTGGNIAINWNKTFSKKSSLVVQSYYDYSKNDIPVLAITEKTFDFDFQHFYNFSSENQFIWGLGYRNIQDNVKESRVGLSTATPYYPIQYSPNTRNIEIYSAFVQDKIGLIANELYLTLGSKFEANDLTGFEYQPNARLTYYPTRNQTWWAAASRAIRTPTRAEDNIEIRGGATTVVNKGSNTYKAEDVIAYEIGYRVKPTLKTTIDIATFYNDYTNLRTFDGISSVPTAGNNGSGETYGFEVDAKWQALDIWRLEASYDYLKSTLHVNAASNELSTRFSTDPLEQSEGTSPRSQFRVRSLLNLTPKFEFDNNVFRVDSLPKTGTASSATVTPGFKNYGTGIKAYTRWDTRLGYLVTRNFDVSVGIQNVLNHQHQEFTAGLFAQTIKVGRTYYLKATLQF